MHATQTIIFSVGACLACDKIIRGLDPLLQHIGKTISKPVGACLACDKIIRGLDPLLQHIGKTISKPVGACLARDRYGSRVRPAPTKILFVSWHTPACNDKITSTSVGARPARDMDQDQAMESKPKLSRAWPAPTEKAGHQSLRRGRVSLPGQIYNITSVTVSRNPFFTNFRAGCAAARCFEDKHLLGDARMLAWVLMPDHAHWLIQIGDNDDLSTVVSRLKSASARQVNRVLERTGALWQRAYHDHALRNDEDVVTVARYIVANPIRAGLVQRAGDYPFWNAIWL